MKFDFEAAVRCTSNMLKSLTAIAWVLVVLLTGSVAHAQNCEGGRVAVSGGYCCWPGQTFDLASNRCAGPPVCPDGLQASGAECVEAGRQSRDDGSFESAGRPARHVDGGLIGAGVALIAVGYLGAAITGIVMGQQTSRGVQVIPNWWVALIPVAHPFAAVGACTSCGTFDIPMIIGGVGGTVLELVGTLLLVLGVVGHEDEPARGPGLTLRPSAPFADLGFSVEARW